MYRRLLCVIIVLCLTQPFTVHYIEAKKSKYKQLKQLEIEVKEQAPSCNLKSDRGDTIEVHYDGFLNKNGQMFDSSRKRGESFSVLLGAGKVIPGWEQGLIGMCVGETREIRIPSDMAYGARGVAEVIPPNSDLRFAVELISIHKAENSMVGVLQKLLSNPMVRIALLFSLIVSVFWQCLRPKRKNSPPASKESSNNNDNTSNISSSGGSGSRHGKKVRSRMDKLYFVSSSSTS